MCDVIKKDSLKRRYATRNKIKAPPKFGNPTFKIGSSTAVFNIQRLVSFPTSRCNSSFYVYFYDVTHDTFQRFEEVT